LLTSPSEGRLPRLPAMKVPPRAGYYADFAPEKRASAETTTTESKCGRESESDGADVRERREKLENFPTLRKALAEEGDEESAVVGEHDEGVVVVLRRLLFFDLNLEA